MAETTTSNQSTRAPIEKTRANGARRVTPPVDIFENGDGFLIVADLPGVEPEGPGNGRRKRGPEQRDESLELQRERLSLPAAR